MWRLRTTSILYSLVRLNTIMNDLMDDHQSLSNPEPIIVVDLFRETLDYLLELLTG